MAESLQQYSASDKEVFDLLMSGKQRLTESVLYELGKDRGIFYSPHDSRDGLVDHLSTLTHDYYDVSGIMQKRETSKRGEKITSVTLDAELNADDIKEIVQDYQKTVTGTETVRSHPQGASGYVMSVEYDEYDYSKTRLIQRQRKDAELEFRTKDGKTTVRMPATEKARAVLGKLKSDLEGRRKSVIKTEEIELSLLTTPDERTRFFLDILEAIPSYSQHTVISLKVSTSFTERDDDSLQFDEDDDEKKAAAAELLSVVRNVALSGSNLVLSPEYQGLRKRGFFITSITWRARQTKSPYDHVQFEIGFDLLHQGKGFKYAVRYAPAQSSGEPSKTFRSVPEPLRSTLLEVIEKSARSVLAALVESKTNPTALDTNPTQESTASSDAGGAT